MLETQRAIFRADAVQRYLQGRNETVLPPFVSPRTFLFLWVLLLLLAAGLFLAWLAKVPQYVPGPAVVLAGKGRQLSVRDVAVLAFLPSDSRSRLRAGQRLWVRFGAAGQRQSLQVVAVEESVLSPEAVERHYRLPAAAAQAVSRPSVVAIARFSGSPEGLPANAHLGAVYPAQIEVGSSRLIALMPFVGHYFGG
jgi:hypothetical protein